MNNSARNVVSAILLIPTTAVSFLLSFLFLMLAANGAPLLVLLSVLTVVWAANIAMWCLLVHALRDKQAGPTQPVFKRWWYYLVLGAGLALIGYAVTDPGRDVWASMALGWVALTLAYFGAMLYRYPPVTVADFTQTRTEEAVGPGGR